LETNQQRGFQFIVETLSSQNKQGRLTPIQEAWIPYAEEALAATDPENKEWKFDLIGIYWRTASFTPNPVRQYVLVISVARNLREKNELTPEQLEWLIKADQYIANLRPSRS
jgi:hypothetical protein